MTRKRPTYAIVLTVLMILSTVAMATWAAGATTSKQETDIVIAEGEDLSFEPVPIALGQPTEMFSGLTNTGDSAKDVSWTLTIGDATIATGEVTVGAGETIEVETVITVEDLEPGTYTATITYTTADGEVTDSTEVEVAESAAGGPIQAEVEVEPNPVNLNEEIELRIEFRNTGDESKTIEWTLNLDTEGGDILRTGTIEVPATGEEAEVELLLDAETGNTGFFPVAVQYTVDGASASVSTILGVTLPGQSLRLPLEMIEFEVEPNPVEPGNEFEVRAEFMSEADADAVYQWRWVLPIPGGEIVREGEVEIPAEQEGEIEFVLTAPEEADVFKSELTLTAFGVEKTFTRNVGIGVDSVQTFTPTPTPSPTAPPTPEPDTPTPTTAPTATQSPAPSPTPTAAAQPGFGVVVALVAILLVSLLAHRRRR